MLVCILIAYYGGDRYIPPWFECHEHPVYKGDDYITGVGLAPQRHGWYADSKKSVENAKADLLKNLFGKNVEFYMNNYSYILKLLNKYIKEGEVTYDHRHHVYFALVYLNIRKIKENLNEVQKGLLRKIFWLCFIGKQNEESLKSIKTKVIAIKIILKMVERKKVKPSDGGIRIEGAHTITIKDIPDGIRDGRGKVPKTLKEKIEALKKVEIKKALKKHNGNKTKAAEELGIRREVLSRYVKKI